MRFSAEQINVAEGVIELLCGAGIGWLCRGIWVKAKAYRFRESPTSTYPQQFVMKAAPPARTEVGSHRVNRRTVVLPRYREPVTDESRSRRTSSATQRP